MITPAQTTFYIWLNRIVYRSLFGESYAYNTGKN